MMVQGEPGDKEHASNNSFLLFWNAEVLRRLTRPGQIHSFGRYLRKLGALGGWKNDIAYQA